MWQLCLRSVAMPTQRADFFSCLCCFVRSGWSRLPVFLTRGSCQCRCACEYVQHVLWAGLQLPKNWTGQSSVRQPRYTPHLLGKTPVPLKCARGKISPSWVQCPPPKPIKQSKNVKKLNVSLAGRSQESLLSAPVPWAASLALAGQEFHTSS